MSDGIIFCESIFYGLLAFYIRVPMPIPLDPFKSDHVITKTQSSGFTSPITISSNSVIDPSYIFSLQVYYCHSKALAIYAPLTSLSISIDLPPCDFDLPITHHKYKLSSIAHHVYERHLST